MKSSPPQITYACELEIESLQALFAQPDVIDFLTSTESAVAMGLLDLSNERAEVVRRLNEAGVPVTAWLLLPKEDGYWFNLDNHAQATAYYEKFLAWSRQNNLHWARVGLDIEPDLRAVQMISQYRAEGVRRLMRHLLNHRRLRRGAQAYRSLVQRIKQDGFKAEAYQFFFILDERMMHSTLLQRMTGTVSLPEVDHEVFMLYSSFARPWGQGILCSYGRQAQGIGVGSTGGGVELEGSLNQRPLNWEELRTDLLLAHQFTQELFVFSLEGCVSQGFLPLLRKMNWQQPVTIPVYEERRVDNLRKILRRGLLLSARPAWLLFGLALLICTIAAARRKAH